MDHFKHLSKRGDLIHALFTYLRQKGYYGPLSLHLPYIIGANPYWWKLSEAERLRVRECWEYLFEMVQLSRKALFEVDGPSGLNTDLVLLHGQTIYVLEIKTGKTGNSKAKKQIKGAIRAIHRKLGTIFPVEGYHLRMQADPLQSFNPVWIRTYPAP